MVACKLCSKTIVDEVLKRTYYDEDYPTIDIGPYCASCMDTIRICSGCHHPKVFDSEIKYYNKGNFYCHECAKDMDFCGICNSEGTVYKTVNGVKYCEKCYKKEFFYCGNCEQDHPRSEGIFDPLIRAQYAGVFKKYKDVCQGCFDQIHTRFKKYNISECKNCGGMFTDDDNSHKYCPRCEAQLPICGICGTQHHKYQRIRLDVANYPVAEGRDNYVCNRCFSKLKKCDNCGGFTMSPASSHGRFFSKMICKKCDAKQTEGLGECKTCLTFGVINSKGQCMKCESLYGNNICECGLVKDDQHNCRACGPSKIYGYSTKPRTYFRYSKRDLKKREAVFMGFENEITFPTREKRDVALKELYKSYGADILIAKSDGSISGYGYEVVIQPMTLDMLHLLNINNTLSPNQQASSSCGMHVHVGRKHFAGNVHIFKVCQFVHNNEKFCDLIAGRKYNGYAGKFDYKASKTVKEATRGNAGRGRRVNLTHPVTIEFRMFAGCTKEFELRYRLEFVHALVMWTKGAPVTCYDVKSFKAYVEENAKMYPNLSRFLTSLGETEEVV